MFSKVRLNLRFLALSAAALLLLAADRTSVYPQEKPSQASEGAVQVVVEGRALFPVRERILSFSPEDRAKAIYQLNAYTNKPSAVAVTYSKLHENIQDSFNKAGVEIMSPQYSAIRDGNDVTIPEEFRKADYAPKAFRVRSPGEALKANPH